jgi:uncharacterized protein
MSHPANFLVHETSPYLLQHAYNPVSWYPWGEEALRRAKEEDKPILVSIGYSACHWCHVMERESFEDEATAAIMNKYFINIKIDREERPDLDHIYMDAVQSMTGSGGWPLNVFLTPDKKPFFGGTYFPPTRAYNRSSWQEVLLGVAQAFRERRTEMDAQADNLAAHLQQSNAFGLQQGTAFTPVTAGELDLAFRNLMQSADKEEGGFGKAPKFPQTHSIRYLLRYHQLTGNAEALQQACLSLDKMIQGGIYDQLGGGFARYATDNEWLAPHFEKMLYDNALLVTVLAEAYAITQQDSYRRAIAETLAFTEREMMDAETGFYAALDADSEGEEGRFYVWSKDEVEALLGDDAALFCACYDVTEAGNWEHKNILRLKISLSAFAEQQGLTEAALLEQLQPMKEKLLEARSRRVRPGLDDKCLLGWNALMNIAYAKAFAVLGTDAYRETAIRNMQCLLKRFKQPDAAGFHHTWKSGEARYPAFLDDYACLISALLHLQEITADTSYLFEAKEITEYVLAHFSEEETGYFYFTHASQDDVIVRKKEVYDGATPSGNALMAQNLYYQAVVFDLPVWRERAEKMSGMLAKAVLRYPSSFGVWALLLADQFYGLTEIAITGPDYEELLREVLKEVIHGRVIQSGVTGREDFPLLAGKTGGEAALVYVCRNYACQVPVEDMAKLRKVLAAQRVN